jgi:hypothetical protein
MGARKVGSWNGALSKLGFASSLQGAEELKVSDWKASGGNRILKGTVRRSVFVISIFMSWPGQYLTSAATSVDFNREVQPILSENCFKCHGPDGSARKAKLRLDTKAGALGGGEDGPVIVPGDSAKSPLYQRIVSTDADEVMPPPKSNLKLSPAQIDLLKRWIDEGAKWGEHWSFTKPIRPKLPEVTGASGAGPMNPIDRFILERLKKEAIDPSPEADPETLARRVALDLTGLPPTVEMVDRFLADHSEAAYEKLVDGLLESPAYGERMAWEWLDAARYADSNGYQGDSDRTMWPWRDWVARAFNRNLPYDEFTIWQLAGDLLPEVSPEQKLATGFARNHMINGEGGRIPEENRVEYVMDVTETVGTVWLGLTFNCCRCHDHKFDPLTRKDYYSLSAFFNQTPVDGSGGDPQQAPNLEWPSEQQTAELKRLNAEVEAAGEAVAKLEGNRTSEGSDAEKKEMERIKAILKKRPTDRSKDEIAALEKESSEYGKKLKEQRERVEKRDQFRKSIPRVMVMQEMEKPRKTFMLERGLYDKRGEEVQAATPGRLPAFATDAPRNRLGLARWLVDPENPLTARVTVNRFWQQFFGAGLVRTPSDFGVQGEKPSHPELLDWLAVDFVESGWDVKRLVRLMVTSATYKQSSRLTPTGLERDPENRLLARGPRYRWPSWMLRDQALAASGLASLKLGGAPVKPYQPDGVWEDVSFGNKKYKRDEGEKLYRRSIYTFWRRIIAPTMFFDTASRQVCSVKQPRTNTPLHALATLNDITYVEAARALAERTLLNAEGSDAERIEFAFRTVLARRPKEDERKTLSASVDRLKHEFAADKGAAEKYLAVGETKRNPKLDLVEEAAYAAFSLELLNLDETLTKE